jgi:uncharacterized protein (DUF885 family)
MKTNAPSAAVFAAFALAAAACGASSVPPAPPLPPPPAATAPAVAASAPLAKTSEAPATNADDAAVDDAARAYIDLLVAISPESATRLGLHSRDMELDDYSLAGFEAALKQREAMRSSLQARFGAHASLSLAKKVDLELLEHSLAVSIRRDRELKPLTRDPGTYLGVLETLFAMIARQYAPAEERARAVVARLEKVPAVIAAAKANLDNPPAVWTQVALEGSKEAPAFLKQVRSFLDATLKDDAGSTGRTARAIGAAGDALADYTKFLAQDLLPRSKGDFAAGRPLFDFILHEGDFLTEDADGVLALGKRVFDETDAQMMAIAKKIDPKAKGWPQVAKRLKDTHPTSATLLPQFQAELARARAFVVQKDVVSLPPGDDCELMETPPFQRSTVTAAYEGAPPFDTHTTKGFFFVTPADATMKPKEQEELLREDYKAEQADTVVHETYPGHHLQVSLARRHPSLVRKAKETDLFAEGWALYSEELMSELGYYTDEERLVQLDWTLVRAARVIIDVGLHTQGMTFDQAVAILTDKVHLERTLALSEVKRYTSTPTQPLSYLVGREKIFALRKEMQEKDPSHFSLKKFHDDLLSHGTIPLALVREEMLGAAH